jgi:hypothetical protein
MPIQNSAILTELNISVWTANKLDKDATKKVTDDNRAARDAGHFRKNLMAGTTKRKEIADFAASCRLWHNTKSLPWADRGPRLLPMSLFFDYKREANLRKQRFEELVDEFVANYPNHVQAAQQSLGDMFDPTEYPSAEEVRSKFGFRLVFTPLPESGDFRVNVGNADMAELQQQYDDAFNKRLADAMLEPWHKMFDLLSSMSAKLDDDNHEGKTRRWHDTFLTNAEDLCQMLTHLNLTGDPELERARQKLERAIRTADLENLKEDASSRSELKGELDSLLKDYW